MIVFRAENGYADHRVGFAFDERANFVNCGIGHILPIHFNNPVANFDAGSLCWAVRYISVMVIRSGIHL